jgi:hypothetical protein
MQFAHRLTMRLLQQFRRYAGRRFTRRLVRSLPWLGGAVALVTIGLAIRKKGAIGGTLHTTLDFIPFVGSMKNVAELVRGSDFFPDKPLNVQPPLKD